MLASKLQPDEPMLAAFSDPHKLRLLHVGVGASAAGLLKQMCRRLQEHSKQQGTAAKSAQLCTAVSNGISGISLGHD